MTEYHARLLDREVQASDPDRSRFMSKGEAAYPVNAQEKMMHAYRRIYEQGVVAAKQHQHVFDYDPAERYQHYHAGTVLRIPSNSPHLPKEVRNGIADLRDFLVLKVGRVTIDCIADTAEVFKIPNKPVRGRK